MEIDNELYKSSLSPRIWKQEERIVYLKHNLSNIERTIEKYLQRIDFEFPFLTDHSILHSKALWNYADIIVGKQKMFLNPLESFALSCAFFIHDAGMCYSILNNKDTFETDPIYKDYITQNGNNKETQDEALFLTVRMRHGENALRVATEELGDGDFLISDIDLREEFGEMIGLISKSHLLDVNFIEEQFHTNYISPKFPPNWSIDRKKLCFLLRTSDAAHIDNLRTPKSVKMIKQIEGVSGEHWTFQKKLGFPELDRRDGLLIYTTNSPFDESEQKAWWFCFDALKTLDRELKLANEFFEISSNYNLAAKGVKSINDTLTLGKKYIRTKNWISLDTNVKAKNPAGLAVKLGGITLYGQPSIAIRELIQNSLDAVNLFRIHSRQLDQNIGKIEIKLFKQNGNDFIEIIDDGIGMSQTILTNQLLDFGGSYWKSNEFKYGYEGAVADGFESLGKFGIGFFSAFMLGDEIWVSSWKYGNSINDMKVLEFTDGLESTPILRNTTLNEKKDILGHGTAIKIKLKKDPYLEKEGFVVKLNNKEITNLYSLIKFYVPSPNVKLIIKEYDNPAVEIPPNIFRSISFKDFLDYVPMYENPYLEQDKLKQIWKALNIELIDLFDKTRHYGRIALLPSIGTYILPTMLIVSGGIKVSTASNLAGYLETDDVISIRRSDFRSNLPFNVMRDWAIKSKNIIEEKKLIQIYNESYYTLLVSFGLQDENTPILYNKENNEYKTVSINDFIDFLKQNNSFRIYQENPNTIAKIEKNCDGFLIRGYNEPYSKLLMDSDKEKIKQLKDFIKEIISDNWTYYEVKDLISNSGLERNQFQKPYWQIREYVKKNEI